MERLKNPVVEASRIEEKNSDQLRIISQRKDELTNLFERSQKEILDGVNVTGNQIHNGVIAIYGRFLVDSPEILENYKSVSRRLKGKEGQQVALISRYERNIACTGFGGPSVIVLESDVMLGELSADELVFQYNHDWQTCFLPTSRYAKNGYRSNVPHIFPDRLQVSDLGKWARSSVDLADMEKLLLKDTSKLIFQSESTTIPMLTVLIGNEEISTWREANSWDDQAEIAYLEVLSNTLSSRLF
ncbi:MAG TPA: hypothetical protein VII94_03695 [Candidatus Saccharimonadales bacterium]